jgi:hypothetical protein
MEQLSEVSAATFAALVRNWILWIAIIGVLYLFSLYIYFYPTPLTQPFVGNMGGSCQRAPSLSA